MPKIFIKPAKPGLLIRFPTNKQKILSQDGEEVEDNREWQRKIIFGDVIIVNPPEPNKTKGKVNNEVQSEGESK